MAISVAIDGYEIILSDGIAITPRGVVRGVPRRFSELEDVSERPLGKEGIAYWMFRDVLPSHVGGLRGDVTLVYPGILPTGELIKTHGHYHPEGPWGTWPELYGVVKGHALFILQDMEGEKVRLVRVKEGEMIMIPPGYGHVMVNIGASELVTFNYVSRLFNSLYNHYKMKRGASVYAYLNGDEVKLVQNNNYKIKEVKLCRPLELDLKEPVLHLAFKPHQEEWFYCNDISLPYRLEYYP